MKILLLNCRKILYSGLGLVGSMALTSLGFTPIDGTVANATTNSSNLNKIIRLRDVWDASLKKLLHIIEK